MVVLLVVLFGGIMTEKTIPFYDFVSEEGVSNGCVAITITRDVNAPIKLNRNPHGAMSGGSPVYIMGTPTEFPKTIDGFKPSDLEKCFK